MTQLSRKLALNKSTIEKIPYSTEGQQIYWDADIPGFGLLVGKRAKTFFVQVDVKDATKPKGYRTVKTTLGRYGDLTPKAARAMVSGSHDDDGNFVPGKRLELKQGGIVAGTDVSLKSMHAEYFKDRLTKSGEPHKESTVDSYQFLLERHFTDLLPLTLPIIARLAPDTVIKRYKALEESSGPMAARNAYTVISAILNYAKVKYPKAIPSNPFAIIAASNVRKPIKERTDCLRGTDFAKFHAGIQGFNETTRDAFLFCLFHGMRPTAEAASLLWEHVDFDKGVLLVGDTKNRGDLHVPLSRQSQKILERCKSRGTKGSRFVFPAVRDDINKTGHVRLQAADLKLRTGLDITGQGLRRSFITVGRSLHLYDAADKLTNHKPKSAETDKLLDRLRTADLASRRLTNQIVADSVTDIHYDQQGIEWLREPLQQIADEIERLLLG